MRMDTAFSPLHELEFRGLRQYLWKHSAHRSISERAGNRWFSACWTALEQTPQNAAIVRMSLPASVHPRVPSGRLGSAFLLGFGSASLSDKDHLTSKGNTF